VAKQNLAIDSTHSLSANKTDFNLIDEAVLGRKFTRFSIERQRAASTPGAPTALTCTLPAFWACFAVF
jgi:hypothetical protein